MAWLQNLAGRAEDLLNKIDKNAATVLNESKTPSEIKIQTSSEVDLPEPQVKSSQVPSVSRIEIVDENNKIQENIDNNIFEKSYKLQDSASSKSSSMHNSFLLSEDVQNYSEKIAKLEYENSELSKQVLNLQHLYLELNNENSNLKIQIDNANDLVSHAQIEMEQYKARAHRILQEKEQLIGLNQENNKEKTDNIFYKYNEELKKEMEFQQYKNEELTEKLNKSTKEVSSLHQQLIMLQNSLQEANKVVQQNVTQQKRNRQISEEDLKLKNQELAQQYNIIKIKSDEIQHLKQVIDQKESTSDNEFESRIKSLTETLMLKQNNLETVTTERNALRLQLEKLENEYHNNLAQLQQRSQVRIINVNDTDDVKSQVPNFMRVSPMDAGVTRRVKHAYSSLDAISIRSAVFLRRYPLARVFIFCYMIILQLWAIFVLFWYAPSGR